ncbi:hypothetical protein AGDE_01822 [Angomonas deanei]|uniref:Uncharacterized protein n=1 Tax=Angomonas deanei TaxID=59799 RepID=S9VIQ6_9TRYP|nr:hypothetical protein AGDE_06410 [Angomonas deanei]EPY40699.1 hypothetical protein AGDE_03228 [Angomonas deanei]EPY42101.1 hypothetical protein AGDE_01822 [Angomonas deanei]CAD2215299.1 hypothetical protein, conserved [Angomonas deanei]|eukprot:EPY37524.1 hypothetical protein AGDE_06410 [Angomonas deanei]
MISASTSPCALIRGFEAVDGTTVALHENIKILPGEGTSIVGLQVIADTNFFHSKMRNGDECDLTVVQKLFPTVRISAHVSLLQPTALMSTVRYKDLEDLEAAKAADGPKKAEGPKKSIRKVKNADGEWVEEEIIVEEKSFIQKYWMYLVVPFVLQIVQGLAKK